MLFNSLPYAIFLVVVFALHWLLPNRFRWIMLLIASYYFYMSWNPELIVLIVLTTLVSYSCALLIERYRGSDDKPSHLQKLFLILALVICLGTLFFFKYFDFFSDSVTAILRSLSLPVHELTLKLILPVGISFYTFQTLSYVIDVYHGKVPAERHLGIYALYVSFFPQLVAGPIERPQNLIPQIRRERTFEFQPASDGLKWIALGLFKKVVIADSLSVYVDMVYGNLAGFHGLPFIVATVFFAFQIYCDFSGYSDIAIGSAKLLGINLMKNFDSPYLSLSLREFWTRWHISLSSWFRDYVYIPLGGNRKKLPRHLINLMLTFLMSGLWHGANWTFVCWGALHGFYVVAETLIHKIQSRFASPKEKKPSQSWLSSAVRLVLTFTLVCFAWVFFRADSMADAFYGLSNMFEGIRSPLHYVADAATKLKLDRYDLLIRLLPVGMLAVFDIANRRTNVFAAMSRWKPVFRWGVYLILIWFILFFPGTGGGSEFIYFQF
ncbi:MAG: MBOAT family protein [Clostridiales bacterium]|nr:MBOAT family protein [Clostridiales bacterium]